MGVLLLVLLVCLLANPTVGGVLIFLILMALLGRRY